MKTALLASILVLGGAAWAAAPAVLVKGSPPLTEEIVARVGDFFEWAFQAQLTSQQRDQARRELAAIWKSGDREEIEGAAGLAGQLLEISKMSKADQDLTREKLLPELLEEMKRDSKAPLAKWAMEVYRSAYTPLAAGDPPLTRQAAEAYLELLCFVLGEASGQKLVPDKALRDAWSASLAASYAGLGAEQRKMLALMPLLRAAVASTWERMSEAERGQQRAQWAQSLRPQPPAAPAAERSPAAAPARPSPANQATLQQLIQQAQSNHRAYMDMSRSMMNLHYSNMNAMNALSGSPWRYEKRY